MLASERFIEFISTEAINVSVDLSLFGRQNKVIIALLWLEFDSLWKMFPYEIIAENCKRSNSREIVIFSIFFFYFDMFSFFAFIFYSFFTATSHQYMYTVQFNLRIKSHWWSQFPVHFNKNINLISFFAIRLWQLLR